MQAGRLNRKISIERRRDVSDDHGQPIPSWQRIGTTRWADRIPVSGTERFTSDQFIGREQVEFHVRWTKDISDLSPMDRVVYPPTPLELVPDSRIYDIMAVHEIGWRDGLRIMAARRAET